MKEQGWIIIEPPRKVSENTWEVVLAPLQLGSLTLPMLLLKILPEDRLIARTKPLTVDVKKGFKTDKQPPEIFELQSLKFPRAVLLGAFFTLTCALLCLIFVFLKLLKKINKRKSAHLREEFPLSAYDKAYKKMLELKQKKLLEIGKFKVFYFEISEIFKEFLEEKNKFPAKEFTTYEIMLEIKKNQILNKRYNEFEKLFYELDRVKFTDYKPSKEEARRIYDETVEFLKY